MGKTRIIFLDMEGTIFRKAVSPDRTKVPPSAWYVIAERLGPEALKEEELTQEKWIKGEYSNYLEWMEKTILIHKKYKLNRKIFYEILDKIDLMPGVKESFSVINKTDVVTCLISGGFKYQANRAIRELKIKHSFIACEYFWDDSGILEHWNLLPADEKGKLDFMKLLISEYRVIEEECAFIGDGDNDIPLAKEVGLSIAFNASEKLCDCATYSIKQNLNEEDFRAVLQYLNV